jgi:hypothetical protein
LVSGFTFGVCRSFILFTLASSLALSMFLEYQSFGRLSFTPKAWVHVRKLIFKHIHLSRGP